MSGRWSRKRHKQRSTHSRKNRDGLSIHTGIVIVIASSASPGILPTTLRAFPHYDLAAHFLLVGLLAFFLAEHHDNERKLVSRSTTWIRDNRRLLVCIIVLPYIMPPV